MLLVVALIGLAGLAGIPPGHANHGQTTRLAAAAAASATWTNPSAVTDPADSTFASTSQANSILTISRFESFARFGSIQGVQFWIRQQQVGHVDDRLRVEARAPGHCGAVQLTPTEFEATSAISSVGISATCDSGWTRAALAALELSIESRPQLVLVDGSWRVMHAAVDVSYQNQAPAAAAGAPAEVAESSSVTLDASGSTDPDPGDPLQYAWQQTQGPSVTLAGPDAARASFTAPSLGTNQPVTLRFQMTVRDSEGHASTATADVVVRNVNQAPLAAPGPAQTVGRSTVVTLDGTASSDPDQDPLTFRWTQTAGPTVTLDSAQTATTTFLAPASDTTLTFLLRVNDPSGAAGSASVEVRVGTGSAASPSPSPTPSASASPSAGPTTSPSPTPGPTASVSPSPSSSNPTPTPSAPASTSPAPRPGSPNVRIEPNMTLLAPGRVSSLRAVFELPNGSTAPDPSPACTWDGTRSGGQLVPTATGSCQAHLEAGPRLGTHFEIGVTLIDSSGVRYQSVADVVIAAPATPEAGPDPVPDAERTCIARFSASTDPVPVLPHADCGLALAVLRIREATPAAWFSARVLTGPPPGVPPAPSTSLRATYLELTLGRPDGQPLALASADLQFPVARAAIEGCREPDCVPVLFHYVNGSWGALPTRQVRSNQTHLELEATTSSFSVFAVGSTRTAVGSPAAAGSLWLTALPWITALGIGSLVALGYVGGRRVARRPRARPEAAARALDADVPAGDNGANGLGAGPSDLIDELRNEELVQFLNNASHDLASPLTPIRLQLHMLTELSGNELNERQKRALEVVGRNVDHLGLLITDLKDASRLQAGKLKLFPEPVDLNTLAAKAAESFQAQADQAKIRLTTRWTDPPPPVTADPGRITQVLYNFLGNALKFTPPGGHIRVETDAADGRAVIRVRDTGRGLSPEDIERLFRPFSQVHGKEEKKKGTGLGLYICKGIAEAHGGRVGCASTGPGRGSTFFIELPLAAGALPRTGQARLSAPAAGTAARA